MRDFKFSSRLVIVNHSLTPLSFLPRLFSLTRKGVYKTGAEIITSKVKTVIGSESQNIIKTLSFDDEQATPQLKELKEKYPANLIVVTGELTIDLPDKITSHATGQKTFNIASNRLTFNSCLLDDAIRRSLALRDRCS